jgi:hypothetical protein
MFNNYSPVIESPCYDTKTKTDCPRRCEGCAINCPEWAEYVEKRDEARRKRYAESSANSAIVNSHMSHSDRRQKRDIAGRTRRRH